jgi:hypothetical protein
LRSFSTGDPADNPDVNVPTGYFKVIYRPPTDNDPAHAIGFLLPHTNEKIDSFWHFISRIDVIEKASGVRFNGIPEDMKDDWSSDFFFGKKVGGWKLRKNRQNNYTAGGWIEDSTFEQRMERCKLQ